MLSLPGPTVRIRRVRVVRMTIRAMFSIVRYFAIAAMVVAILPAASVSAQSADGPSVTIQDNQFMPATLQATVGATVTWSHNGGTQHTVTADDASFDSGVLNPGDMFTTTFTAPGTYPYYCDFHGGPGGQGMSGTIVVS